MLAVVLGFSLCVDVDYKVVALEGWNVNIRTEIFGSKATNAALSLLKGQLAFIKKTVPNKALKDIQKVKLYFSPNYPDGSQGGAYHPSADWLSQNGRDPSMAQGIEFVDLKNFDKECKRMPAFALHELSHGFHHRFLDDGFDNGAIKAVWESAKKSGKYDRVERKDHLGNVSFEKAYAMTDSSEYFAELTEAFFSINDFYPYNKAQLRKFDPKGYQMVKDAWGVTE